MYRQFFGPTTEPAGVPAATPQAPRNAENGPEQGTAPAQNKAAAAQGRGLAPRGEVTAAPATGARQGTDESAVGASASSESSRRSSGTSLGTTPTNPSDVTLPSVAVANAVAPGPEPAPSAPAAPQRNIKSKRVTISTGLPTLAQVQTLTAQTQTQAVAASVAAQLRAKSRSITGHGFGVSFESSRRRAPAPQPPPPPPSSSSLSRHSSLAQDAPLSNGYRGYYDIAKEQLAAEEARKATAVVGVSSGTALPQSQQVQQQSAQTLPTNEELSLLASQPPQNSESTGDAIQAATAANSGTGERHDKDRDRSRHAISRGRGSVAAVKDTLSKGWHSLADTMRSMSRRWPVTKDADKEKDGAAAPVSSGASESSLEYIKREYGMMIVYDDDGGGSGPSTQAAPVEQPSSATASKLPAKQDDDGGGPGTIITRYPTPPPLAGKTRSGYGDGDDDGYAAYGSGSASTAFSGVTALTGPASASAATSPGGSRRLEKRHSIHDFPARRAGSAQPHAVLQPGGRGYASYLLSLQQGPTLPLFSAASGQNSRQPEVGSQGEASGSAAPVQSGGVATGNGHEGNSKIGPSTSGNDTKQGEFGGWRIEPLPSKSDNAALEAAIDAAVEASLAHFQVGSIGRENTSMLEKVDTKFVDPLEKKEAPEEQRPEGRRHRAPVETSAEERDYTRNPMSFWKRKQALAHGWRVIPPAYSKFVDWPHLYKHWTEACRHTDRVGQNLFFYEIVQANRARHIPEFEDLVSGTKYAHLYYTVGQCPTTMWGDKQMDEVLELAKWVVDEEIEREAYEKLRQRTRVRNWFRDKDKRLRVGQPHAFAYDTTNREYVIIDQKSRAVMGSSEASSLLPMPVARREARTGLLLPSTFISNNEDWQAHLTTKKSAFAKQYAAFRMNKRLDAYRLRVFEQQVAFERELGRNYMGHASRMLCRRSGIELARVYNEAYALVRGYPEAGPRPPLRAHSKRERRWLAQYADTKARNRKNVRRARDDYEGVLREHIRRDRRDKKHADRARRAASAQVNRPRTLIGTIREVRRLQRVRAEEEAAAAGEPVQVVAPLQTEAEAEAESEAAEAAMLAPGVGRFGGVPAIVDAVVGEASAGVAMAEASARIPRGLRKRSVCRRVLKRRTRRVAGAAAPSFRVLPLPQQQQQRDESAGAVESAARGEASSRQSNDDEISGILKAPSGGLSAAG